MMTDVLRHFIIAGAQRSATTFLMQMLDAHPQIEMAKPVRPEPKVFLGDGFKNLTRESYLASFFQGRTSQTKWLGEKSTSYYENADTAGRIVQFLEAPKIIFVLRDPVERAISNYHFSRMHGFETADIDTALLREIDNPDDVVSSIRSGTSVSPQAYLARGRYIDFLPAFYDTFPKDDILLIHSEKLTREPSEQIRIFDFLELVPKMSTVETGPVNASQKDGDQTLSADARTRLADYFRQPNAELSQTYDFDISAWQ